MHGVTVKIKSSSNNKQCLLQKVGGDKTQGVHSTSKSRGTCPSVHHDVAFCMTGTAVVTLTTPKATAVTRRLNMSSSLLTKYQIQATGLGSSSTAPAPHVTHGRHLSNATRRQRVSDGSSDMPWRVTYIVSCLRQSVYRLFIYNVLRFPAQMPLTNPATER